MKFTWVNVRKVYWNVERRIFLADLWASHTHSLGNLVVCTNLNFFLLPKDEEKKFEKSFFF